MAQLRELLPPGEMAERGPRFLQAKEGDSQCPTPGTAGAPKVGPHQTRARPPVAAGLTPKDPRNPGSPVKSQQRQCRVTSHTSPIGERLFPALPCPGSMHQEVLPPRDPCRGLGPFPSPCRAPPPRPATPNIPHLTNPKQLLLSSLLAQLASSGQAGWVGRLEGQPPALVSSEESQVQCIGPRPRFPPAGSSTQAPSCSFAVHGPHPP